MTENKPVLMLVDGHSLAFRAYYAFARGPEGGLRTSTGIPTSVCYGFLKSMLDIMAVEQPDYAAVAFDLAGPTFRHQADDTYKDGRPEPPPGFLEDVDNLQELLQAFGLPTLTAAGFEADDVLGTVATRAKTEGYRVKILSGDQDLFQLIDDAEEITVLHLRSTQKNTAQALASEFKIQTVKDKLGILPNQVIDYKALCGDTSDNIPGVKGIGAKTAAKLLDEYTTLANVYANVENIKGATQKKLIAGEDSAKHSQFMARIVVDVPLAVNLADCKLDGFEVNQVTPLLKKLELHHFLQRLNKIQGALGGKSTAEDPSGSSFAPPITEGGEDVSFFTPEETEQANFNPPQAVQIQPQIITSKADLNALVERLAQHRDPTQPVAWDTETTSIEPRDAELVGIGCCWGTGQDDMAYIPTGHQEGTQLASATVLEILRPILESADYPKALQNAKFDRLVLRCQGIQLAGVVFDPMLASYVLNPETTHNLTDLSLKYLNLTAQSYTDLVPKGKTIADIDIESVATYCGADVFTTFQLVSILQHELDQNQAAATLFKTLEVPLEPVLADMEFQGVRIDQDYLRNFSAQLEIDLNEIEHTAYNEAEETFNLGSPKQLSELLFTKLGLDKRKSRRNKSGGYSTDAATLEKLQGDHPVVDLIVKHRTLSKLKSTYVDALPNLVRPDTQRVHTDFNQAVTATGRLSSSNPNLQNIPIRTEFSRQIRAAFVPQPGWLLVSADYSQIELRILAHLSDEPVLVNAYKNNQDVHTLTAQLLFEKDEISTEERRLGKVINFGIIYGMGAARFAREANVSRTEAKTFIDRFNDSYPNVFEYLQQMQREAIAYGYVHTLMGRRRYFNFTSHSLRNLKGQDPSTIALDKLRPNGYDAGSLRAAANAPIQGSNADIIKVAMIQLHKLLQGYQARLLLQVHDELVFEVPPEEWKDLEVKIKTTMESAAELNVPLLVEAAIGANWMEAK